MRRTWITGLALVAAGCGSSATTTTAGHTGTGTDKGLLVLDPPIK